MEDLYALANDIVKVTEQNNNKVIYQQVSGMYNERVLDGNSSKIISQSEDMQIFKYDENIENIKNWMRKEEKNKAELENYMKGT